jgi:hypothetical protein
MQTRLVGLGVWKRAAAVSALLTLLTNLSGCGGSGADESPLPIGATVQIDPNQIDWEITQEYLDEDGRCRDLFIYNDHTFSVSVTNQNGSPLGDVKLRIVATQAGNSSNIPFVRLYEDYNGNGVIDHPAELVTGSGMPAYETKTERYTGHKFFMARVNLSCEHRVTVWAFAESAVGSTTINVKLRQQ